ncbi:MAG TPA: amidase family protein, partial [Cryomorphaceae bacterium]|nr:amidase family protein [Cryomorphaceae bacterium]
MKNYHSLLEIQSDLDQNSLELKDLVGHYLKNIKASENLNIFLEVYEEEALDKAEEISNKLKSGTAGRLAGMVIALKDNICYKDHKLGAASKILDGFESLYDATVTKKILDEDAIIIGRVNC